VIDDREQVDRLIAMMRASLPLSASMGPELRSLMRQKLPDIDGTRQFHITRIDYLGDDGGIVCALELGQDERREVYVVSMTHLHFSPRGALTREIAAYQKHRVKRLRRLKGS